MALERPTQLRPSAEIDVRLSGAETGFSPERVAMRRAYWFKRVRLEAGMTQAEAGRLLHVSQSTVSNWENGRVVVPHAVLERFEHHTGLSIFERSYLHDELRQGVSAMTLSGELTDPHLRGLVPHELGVFIQGRRVATRLFVRLLGMSRTSLDVVLNWVRCSPEGATFEGRTLEEIPPNIAHDILYDGDLGCRIETAEDHSYLLEPLDWIEAEADPPMGVLSRLAQCGIRRPIWPSSFDLSRHRYLSIGRFIPTASYRSEGTEVVELRQMLKDPLHALVAQLASLSQFPSVGVRCRIYRGVSGLEAAFESPDWEWHGELYLAVRCLLHMCSLDIVDSDLVSVSWNHSLQTVVDNLAALGALRLSGPAIDVSPDFVSQFSAVPSHPINRPEKVFRKRLAAGLAGMLEARGRN